MRSRKDRNKIEVWGRMYVGICIGNGQHYVCLVEHLCRSTYEGKESGMCGKAKSPRDDTYSREDGSFPYLFSGVIRSLQE